MKLSKRKRIALDRSVDLFNSFELVRGDYQTPYSATLFARISYPKDEKEREEYNNRGYALHSDMWPFLPELSTSIYYPLKRIENIRGRFSFYDVPIPACCLPFVKLSIEFEFDEDYEMDRYVGIDCSMIDTETRGRIMKEPESGFGYNIDQSPDESLLK